MRIRDLIFGAVLFVNFPVGLQSQTTATVAVGNRVRVLAPSLGSESREGVLSSVSAGQLHVRESSRNTHVVATNQLMRLDVWGPGSGTQAGKGAAIGAISGGIIFGVGGYVWTRCPGVCAKGEYSSGLGTLLAVPGAGVGALIGLLIGRSERSVGWQPVQLPLQLSIAPTINRKFRVSGSLVF